MARVPWFYSSKLTNLKHVNLQQGTEGEKRISFLVLVLACVEFLFYILRTISINLKAIAEGAKTKKKIYFQLHPDVELNVLALVW